jgi:hypothetical protein
VTPFDLLILSLATWRLAFFITKEDGPFHLAAKLRQRFPLGGLTNCIKCASFWCAALLMLLTLTALKPLVLALAISGGALMLASYTGANHP